jgi:hypothetical protein
MQLVNLTPHPVQVMRVNGTFIELPKGSIVPRLATTETVIGEIDGAKIVKTIFGATVDLPEAADDTILIVSRLVKDANPGRTDLVCPGAALRDETGKIIGADGFSV